MKRVKGMKRMKRMKGGWADPFSRSSSSSPSPSSVLSEGKFWIRDI
jgi:hypothetical protein